MAEYWKHNNNNKIEFSVSFTKFRLFEECEFKYALQTYGTWSEGLCVKKEDRNEVLCLKRLNTMDTILGTVIHDAIAEIASLPNPTPYCVPDNIYEYLYNDYNERLTIAKHNTYTVLNGARTSADKLYLKEIYFKEDRDTVTKKYEKVIEKLKRIANNLPKSLSYQDILEVGVKILLSDKTVGENKFPNFRYQGDIVYAKVDFLYEIPQSNNLILVDWKTGEKDTVKDKEQLLLYAIYLAESKYRGDYSKVNGIFYVNEYLLENKRFTYFLNDNDIEKFKEDFQIKVDKLKAKNKSVEDNIPLDIGHFKKAEDENVCRLCLYKAICAKY
ncbi:PD-(D/E)XK nuclease family protein [Ruminiclostridium cellulolyticum]|uniref:PD-(D/E)XK endonuclease-like domain-containing protein n=1 Tax=Ruminiclostridium cellulolyticum (strain ATCC 35319 / DSM 5812 / JCM 6584 / H10) TaxID=394503 RepID=B8I7G0_RUMCH|nr:PD-(D/E)XK nuclease family protein [Ruminiclostridium cellulolyticum]ACL77031.1 hypothetical protein Ccel_2720 [Ruminiclostridium cellulolyticum H10]